MTLAEEDTKVHDRSTAARSCTRRFRVPVLGHLLIAAILLCAAAAPATASSGDKASPEVVRLLEEILTSQQNTVTLEGRFTQLKTMALFKDPERSTGRFSFRQPDLMRLDYETPNLVILLLEGDHLTTYYPELKEAEQFDVRKQKKRVFDHLIGKSGIDKLQKNFTIVLGPGNSEDSEVQTPSAGEETHRLRLLPRRRRLKRRIDFIDLWVRASDYAPVQYFIKEKSGDTTLFRLEQVKINGDVPESVFRIDYPDDVTLSVRTGKDDDSDEK